MDSALNKRQIDEFFDIGFTTIERFFDECEMAEISAGFDRLLQIAEEIAASPEFDPDKGIVEYDGSYFDLRMANAKEIEIRKVAWCGGAVPVLLHYGRHPRLLRAASQLLDSAEMNHLINQAHLKMPGTKVAFGWHQDSVNRGFHKGLFTDVNGRGSFVQTGLAVDPVSSESGPLTFISNIGKGHLPHSESGRLSADQVDESRQVTPLPNRGDLLLWHPFAIHGSNPNTSQQPRRILINGYAYPGATQRRYAGSEKGAGELIRANLPGTDENWRST